MRFCHVFAPAWFYVQKTFFTQCRITDSFEILNRAAASRVVSFFTQRLQDNRQSKLRSVEVIFPCDTINIVELPVSYLTQQMFFQHQNV
ncbi:Uncharacterised protein [Escherichia coli]|uniref:Uncharacterized protein n=1 Tax=Escherichia coli TaxID=562 RepID=A0A377KDR7_ECOLX|nr:Uncharacterised protein [Escherichia coli]